jgi:2-polyprenyl-3-methyl-5-hydroxy-6-metoxy-1,4-benzoquinol methylase
MEAAAVRAGWLLVDAHERLSFTGARRIFGHENDAWREYTEDSLVKLRQPPEDDDFFDHESMTNLQRYRRTMDFVRPGDRVFDVGFGRGYLAAQLVQVCGIESYEGIDVLDEFLSMSLRLFEVNDLADAAIHLETGDLYDLTRDRLDAVGATLVICCEVLEHVADPELALRTLADALPDGADLLFSVPLHGRLEGVWGHITVFDVARLKDMLDAAGLTAHHVEPLANTWTLVVASRSSEASLRVREAHGRPAVRASYPLVAHRDYRTLRAGDGTPTGPSSDVATEMDEEGDSWATCRVTDRGGVSWKVAGLEALRLRFDLVDIEHVRRFVVAAYAGRRRVGTWVWSPRPGQVLTGVRTFSLRPGEQAAHFASGPHRRLFRADKVEIRAVTSRGKRATFKVRAAYLP